MMSLSKPTEVATATRDSRLRLLLPLAAFEPASPLVTFSLALCQALPAELILLTVLDEDEPDQPRHPRLTVRRGMPCHTR